MLIHDDLQIISFYVLSFNYNRKGYCSYYGTRIICIGTPPPSTWRIKKKYMSYSPSPFKMADPKGHPRYKNKS